MTLFLWRFKGLKDFIHCKVNQKQHTTGKMARSAQVTHQTTLK